MKKTIVYATLLTASIAGTATAAVGSTGGPVDCVTAEGCPTTVLSEASVPVIDWPEDILKEGVEIDQLAGGIKCSVEVEIKCGPIRA